MKKNLTLFSLLGVLFILNSYCASAQRIPAWVSDKGYWVIETRLQQPGKCIVRFYDNAGTLLHTERLEGAELDIRKRRVKMRLRKALDTVVAARENHQPVRDSASLLMPPFKRGRQ